MSGQVRQLTVQRAVPGGMQIFAITGPVVLATATDAAVSHVPGMKDLLSAGRKPVEALDLTALQIPVSTGTTVTIRASAPPTVKARRRHLIDATDPAAAAAELVGALRGDGVL